MPLVHNTSEKFVWAGNNFPSFFPVVTNFLSLVVYSVNFDDVIEDGGKLGPFEKNGKLCMLEVVMKLRMPKFDPRGRDRKLQSFCP